MTIVDSSVWVDYFAKRVNAETRWLDQSFGKTPMGLTDLILCEVLQGVRSDANLRRVRRDLDGFQVIDSGGEAIAVAAARNYRMLRSRGVTVRTTVDTVIATVCLLEGYSLLHRDRDFNAFESLLGLQVIHA